MPKLDLHGERHSDVKRLVINFVEDNWDNFDGCLIVTGHSVKMRSIVIEVLDEYHLEYRLGGAFGENNGTITLKGG